MSEPLRTPTYRNETYGGGMTDTFHQRHLAGARFEEVDLTGATFQQVYLKGAIFRDVDISGDFENLRVQGIDVVPLVEAELDRRHPERLKLRPTDAAGFR